MDYCHRCHYPSALDWGFILHFRAGKGGRLDKNLIELSHAEPISLYLQPELNDLFDSVSLYLQSELNLDGTVASITQPLSNTSSLENLPKTFCWEDNLSCGIWNCPLEKPSDMKEECFVCTMNVPVGAFLPCPACTQPTCILCLFHLFSCSHRSSEFRCPFCRNRFSDMAANQLVLYYLGHRQDIPVSSLTWYVL